MTDEKKNMEEEVDVITLEFDDGVELECEIMGVFEHAGKEYIALIPDDDSDDVYIYGYKEVGDDEFELVDIEDDAEFEAAVAEFDAIMAEGHTPRAAYCKRCGRGIIAPSEIISALTACFPRGEYGGRNY